MTAAEISVDLHGLAVRIHCPLPEVREAIGMRLARLPAARPRATDVYIDFVPGQRPHRPPAGARPVYESEHGLVVHAPGEDELYAVYGGVTLRCRPVAGRAEIAIPRDAEGAVWLLSRPMLTLPLMEIARRRGLYPLHAACLSLEGRGVLVTGPSGAGKTTLAVALAELGLDFLSDDLVFLAAGSDGVRALGFPDEIGLASDTDAAPAGWPKARADIGELVETTIAGECRPDLLVVLGGDGEVDDLSAEEALLELLPSVLLTERDACAAHLAVLGALAEQTRAVRAPRRDAGGLAHLVAEMLSQTILEPTRELVTT